MSFEMNPVEKKANLRQGWKEILVKRVPLRLAELVSDISPIVPFYHMVSNQRVVHICHLYPYRNERQFIADIDFLCSRYKPVSLFEIIDHVKGGARLEKGSFILTFDDGFNEMYSVVAPILSKKGISAVFFLNTSFIDNKALAYKNKASVIIEQLIRDENSLNLVMRLLGCQSKFTLDEAKRRILSITYQGAHIIDEIAENLGISFKDYLARFQPYLTKAQVRSMVKQGFCFGAHSKDHPLYADLSLEEQVSQTLDSLKFVRNEFNLPYSVFAFPHHDRLVTEDFFRAIESQVDLTFASVSLRRDSVPFHLPRVDLEKTSDFAANGLKFCYIKNFIDRLRNNAAPILQAFRQNEER
ncbi:MAG: polysaccharide deacetylase family protein [Planctomycetes bacterium]|nr:polysaccharide deacetylase family protein [Planctomycetota bacterium]